MTLSQLKKTIPNFFIIFGIFLLVMAFGPIVGDELWYRWKEFKDQRYSLNAQNGVEDSVFARYISTRPVNLTPVNTEFGLVIEKLGVNVPVVRDVTVTNEKAYLDALKDGVAHASTAPYPSDDPGNVYLFAHSAIDFWRFGKYAKVFNLLRKLEVGDRVHVFYENDLYVYEVVNTEIHKGWNTYPLTRKVIEPTLTLQTCDPPGTTLNRLVVTANLVEVQEDYQIQAAAN